MLDEVTIETGVIVITDLLGREIKRVPHFKGTSLIELNDDELNSGTYLYTFEVNDHKLCVKKMIKL